MNIHNISDSELELMKTIQQKVVKALLAIQHYRKMSKRMIALALALTLLLTACGTVPGASLKREDEEQIETPLPTEENSEWELPPVSEPDEDGNFPPIYENAWNRYVNGKIGLPMEQGDLSDITPFMETVRCLKWLEETYPEIGDWNVLHETHQFDYVSEAYDPYTFQRRGQYIPRRTVVLATEQSEQFDRLFIDASIWCDVYFVNDPNTNNDMYCPKEVLNATVSHGWEKDWQLENYADVTAGMPSEYAFPYLWNPNNKRAVLIDDGKSYPIGAVDEEPWGLRSTIYNKAQHGAGNWYMELMKDDQVKAAYYNDNSQQLAIFEQSENTSQLLIESERLILQARDKILFYDIGDHFSVKPVKVIGGNGNGLSDKSIEIRSICAENDDCSEFAIFYHFLDENEWHICSFDQYGEIRSNFNTRLAVVKDMRHFEGCYIKEGILHFRYYPNGMGYRDPYTDYEVNLRDSSIVPAISPTNYHFVLGDSKEGKTLAVGDEIGSWKLDHLEVSHLSDGPLHHVFADFSGEVTLEGTIVRNGMMENGYDFIVKESDRFYFPKISEGGEVNRVYMDISEEMKAALNLDFGEELPARITINEYNYRFTYTEAMNSVAVTELLPIGENLTDE